ncbi:MAG: calcium-binding protein [Cyanobacteria bacterium P01_A01_bin.37]
MVTTRIELELNTDIQTRTNYNPANGSITVNGNDVEFAELLPDNQNIDEGSASFLFDGNGIYNVTIAYFNEGDGDATVDLKIGDTSLLPNLFEFTGGQGGGPNAGNYTVDTLVSGVSIQDNSTLIFEAFRDAGERARVDYLEFTPVQTGLLNFSQSSVSVEEGNTLSISIDRSEGSDGVLNASVTIPGIGTAPVTFADGETTKNVLIPIADDSVVQGDRTFLATITSSDGSIFVGTQDTASITVTDNDTSSGDGGSGGDSGGSGGDSGGSGGSIGATPQSDNLKGGSADDKIRGLAGADVIRSRAGKDFVSGNQDDDRLFGDAGDDVMRGRTGNDRMRGGGGDDDMFGDRGNDNINGGAGDDIIRGGAGRDIINGAKGDDVIFGNGRVDDINGGSGDDVIVGGRGNDELTGGSGEDVFAYRRVADGVDTITDFTVGEDLLDFTSMVAFYNLSPANVFTENIRLVQQGSVAVVQFDRDGAGSAANADLVRLENVSAAAIDTSSFIFS